MSVATDCDGSRAAHSTVATPQCTHTHRPCDTNHSCGNTQTFYITYNIQYKGQNSQTATLKPFLLTGNFFKVSVIWNRIHTVSPDYMLPNTTIELSEWDRGLRRRNILAVALQIDKHSSSHQHHNLFWAVSPSKLLTLQLTHSAWTEAIGQHILWISCPVIKDWWCFLQLVFSIPEKLLNYKAQVKLGIQLTNRYLKGEKGRKSGG